MTALSAGANRPVAPGAQFDDPAAAAVECFAGSLIVLDSSGNAKPAVTGTGLISRGVCYEYVDNLLGAAAAKRVKSRPGVFGFENSGGADEITKAEIGDACYIVDDNTVAKTSGSATRSVAGKVMFLEAGKIFVQVGTMASADGDLLASNNLSDVAAAATARANIGANVGFLNVRVPLNAAGVFYLPLPKACTVIDLRSAVEGATTANGAATITAALDTTNITGGVITIASGAVVGEKDNATPSAANVATEAQNLRLTVATNGQDAAAFAHVSVEFTY